MKTRITLLLGTDVPDVDTIDWTKVLGVKPKSVDIQTQSLYEAFFEKDYYRQGSIDAAYRCNAKGKKFLEAVAASGKKAYLGEVLGKHSEVITALKFTFSPTWSTGEELPESGYTWVRGLDPLGSMEDTAYDDLYDVIGDKPLTEDLFLAWCRDEELPEDLTQ